MSIPSYEVRSLIVRLSNGVSVEIFAGGGTNYPNRASASAEILAELADVASDVKLRLAQTFPGQTV
jgi:hypothetical protein